MWSLYRQYLAFLWTVYLEEKYLEIIQAVLLAVVDSILEVMYVESVQAVPVAILDNILEETYVEIVQADQSLL